MPIGFSMYIGVTYNDPDNSDVGITMQALDQNGKAILSPATVTPRQDTTQVTDQSKLTVYYVDENTGKILDGNNGNVVTENPELVQPAKEDTATGDTHDYVEDTNGSYVKVLQDSAGYFATDHIEPQYVEASVATSVRQEHAADIASGKVKLQFAVDSNGNTAHYTQKRNVWTVPIKQFAGYTVDKSPKIDGSSITIPNSGDKNIPQVGHIVLRNNDAAPAVVEDSNGKASATAFFPDREGQSARVYIFYKGNQQTATVTYEDVTNPNNPVILRQADGNPAVDTVTGPTGVTSNYSSAERIKYFEGLHYVLKNDGTKSGIVFSTDGTKNQYVVTFTHSTDDNVTQQKTVTRTINYVYAGNHKQAAAPNTQTVTFTRTVNHDNVTGQDTPVAGQDWKPSQSGFEAVTAPIIAGYTSIYEDQTGTEMKPVTVPAATNITANTVNSTVTVYYKQADAQQAQIDYLDQDDNNALLHSDQVSGTTGSTINYSTANELKQLEAQGYLLVSDGFQSGAVYDGDTNVPQVFKVILKHGTQTVTPTTPGTPGTPLNPNDPDGPKYPAGTDHDSLVKTGTQTVHHMGAGTQTPKDNISHVTFNRTLVLDKVTGHTVSDTWTPATQTYQAVTTPTIEGYTPNPNSTYVGGETVGVDNPNRTYTVTYTKVTTPTINDQHAQVKYLDQDNNNQEIAGTNSGDLTGKPGTQIKYSTTDTLAKLAKEGYVLANNGFDYGNQVQYFDSNDATTQVFIVSMKHGTTTVTPDNPGTPGQPIDPDNPTGPKYPAGTDAKSLITTGTQTVQYTGAGEQTPKESDTTVQFHRTIVLDNVTGKKLSDTWTPDAQTFQVIGTPTVQGYTPDRAYVGGETVSRENPNRTYTVTYTKDAVLTVNEQNAEVRYLDLTNGNQEIANSGSLTGKPNTRIKYSTAATIKALTDQGYELVNNGFDADNQVQYFDNNDQIDQIYTVTLKHGTQSITPTTPGTPGQPINPNDPKSPNYPAGTDKESLIKHGTQTVYYVGAGEQTPKDSVTTVDFGHDMVLDKVTGQIIQDNGWKPITEHYQVVDTPTIDGYTADRLYVGGDTVTANNPNRTYTVTYVKNSQGSQTSQGSQSQGSEMSQGSQTSQGSQSQGSETSQGSQSEGSETSQGSQSQGSETSQSSQSQGSQTSQGSESQGSETSQGSQSQGSQTSQGSQSQGSETSQGSQSQGSQTSQGSESQGSETSQGSQSQGSQTSQGSQSQGSQTSQGSESQGSQTSQSSQSQGSQTSQGSESQGSETSQGSESQGSQTSQGSQSQGSETSQGSESQGSQTSQGSESQGSQTSQGSQSQGSETSQGSQSQGSQTSQGSQSQGSETSQGSQSQGSQTSQGSQSQGSETSQGSESQGSQTSQGSESQGSQSSQTPTTDTEKVTITYVDPDGSPITTDTVTGKSGQPINYDQTKTITELKNKGYDVTNITNPTTGQNFDNNPSVDQTYTVTVKHGTAQLGPNDQHESGTPINPNDPNGAKWPAKDTYSKDYTYTAHFVGPNGETLTGDNVQTSTWTRTVTVDKVTGKVISGTDWTPSQKKYSNVQVPVVDGYYTTQKTITGQPTVKKNISTTVSYQKLGQIVPVDQNGKQIGTGQTYQNDPNDPTKIAENQTVPSVDGYTPTTSTVTPTNPGENTTVTYTKNGDNGSTTNGGNTNTDQNNSSNTTGSSTTNGGQNGTTSSNQNTNAEQGTTSGTVNGNGTYNGNVAGNSQLGTSVTSSTGNGGHVETANNGLLGQSTGTTGVGAAGSSANSITLPQTGNSADESAILAAAGIELAGALGLAGLAAKKKREN
ncbi:mucin-binding protein [Limosilactobacillus kribbianus]|uniref:mucin-binding protein n=1 Tax=Limosilactobacillus kribbianus TaxID=2982695 RepID=UPI0022641353|nr:LPXTG cell wall anchor domain-containing protein [Limosilactobacillus kribbianus]